MQANIRSAHSTSKEHTFNSFISSESLRQNKFTLYEMLIQNHKISKNNVALNENQLKVSPDDKVEE